MVNLDKREKKQPKNSNPVQNRKSRDKKKWYEDKEKWKKEHIKKNGTKWHQKHLPPTEDTDHDRSTNYFGY